jgi:hypothetical protein
MRVSLPVEMRTSYLQSQFQYYRTAKGYLTADAVNCWVDQVLMPYVAATRTLLGRNFPVFLILDGLKTHFAPHARDIFEQERATVIPLPPHASHLYQILDLCKFGVMKRNINNGETARPPDLWKRNWHKRLNELCECGIAPALLDCSGCVEKRWLCP